MAIAVHVDPAHAGPKLAESVREQRLPPKIVERRIDVVLPAEEGGRVLEQRVRG
jgi:hypothetical protein